MLVAGCDDRPKQWDASIYPNRHDLSVSEEIRGFKMFDLCQQAAINRLRMLPEPDGGDYECGYMCAPNIDFGGIAICKETRK